MANSRSHTGASSEYDAGLMLFEIAGLPSWSIEGVSYSSVWGKGKTPGGVKDIRKAASTDISKMHDIVVKHSAISNLRSKKTEAFYQLVREVHLYRDEGSSPKELIDEFCFKHLNDADRHALPGAAKINTNPLLSAFRSFI